nr:hypothetical protein [Tanacetum cinerariifolium]
MSMYQRNNTDLEEQSLDDFFNSLKIYKAKVKSSSSASTTTQNIAFVSSSNIDNTNEPVSAAVSVTTAKGRDTLQGSVGLLKIQEGMAAMTRVFKQKRSLPTMLLWPSHLQVILLTIRQFLIQKLVLKHMLNCNGYHVVPSPYTGTFMPPKPDLVFNNAPNDVETDHPAFNVKLSHTKPDNNLHVVRAAVLTQSKLVPINAVRPVSTVVPKISVTRPRQAKTVIPKTNSPSRRHINHSPSLKASNSLPRVTAVKAPMVNVAKGNPQHALKDKGVIDNGCSRHITRNMSYLSDFEELNGGYVAFRGNPKGGKISGKGSRTEFGFKRAFATLSCQDTETFTGTMFLNVEQLEKQLDKEDFQGIGPMAAFNVLETQLQMFITNQDYLNDEYIAMTHNYFIQYTGQAIPEFLDTLIQHLEFVKKTIDERVQPKREHDSWVNERKMQTTEEKDTSSRSGNDAHNDDADTRPIYDEELMAEVQTIAKIDVFAIGQQHTEQPKFNNEGKVVQNAEEYHDTCPSPAILTDNQIPEHSYQSLKSKNSCLKKIVA